MKATRPTRSFVLWSSQCSHQLRAGLLFFFSAYLIKDVEPPAGIQSVVGSFSRRVAAHGGKPRVGFAGDLQGIYSGFGLQLTTECPSIGS
jgi:hypothetical protein